MSGYQLTTVVHRAREAVASVAGLVHLLTDPVALVSRARAVVEVFDVAPPGDPDAVEAVARTYRDVAVGLADVRAGLEGVSAALPHWSAGVVSGTLVQATGVMVRGFEGAEHGLSIAEAGVRCYAGRLREARERHAAGRARLAAGEEELRGAVARYDVLGVDLPLVDVPETVGRAREALATLREGARECEGAYSDLVVARAELSRVLSDSAGHATMGEVHAAPDGWNALDVAVMSAQSLSTRAGVEDPDRAVMTASSWRALSEEWDALSVQDRQAVQAALGRVDDPTGRAVVLGALASGATAAQVLFLARQIRNKPSSELRSIFTLATHTANGGKGAEVELSGEAVTQTDDTRCGPTSLVVLVAQSDPLLAWWVATGERAPGYAPGWLDLTADQWDADGVTARLTAAQAAMHRAGTDGQALPWGSSLPWPTAIGTPPWGAEAALDGVSSTTGTGYRHVLVDNRDPVLMQEVLTSAAAALDAGHPVPIYVGGDTRGGLDAAAPRHVVLLTGYADGAFTVYEPSYGLHHVVAEADLLSGDAAMPALGGWRHVQWVVLPTGDPRAVTGA